MPFLEDRENVEQTISVSNVSDCAVVCKEKDQWGQGQGHRTVKRFAVSWA